jgi:hypothetical protein
VIARNLMGRLNARTPDDLQRIAAFWRVPIPEGDRGRQIGALYRAMTDIRHARDTDREIVRELVVRDLTGSTVDEIAELTGIRPATAREAAIRLFHGGVLAREGDSQELPIGTLPRLFLPREVASQMRRVQDELDAGDLSGTSLRVILETLDDTELEEAATRWGIRVIPGQRRRHDLIQQILRQVDQPDRVESMAASQASLASAIWTLARQSAPEPVARDDAISTAARAAHISLPRDPARSTAMVLEALGSLESSLLVIHTYRRDGTRWLFVPQEIANAGEKPRALPLLPAQPVAADRVAADEGVPSYAIAWDLLTLLRDIATHGAPTWVPGEPVSRTWQRRLNRRLWFAGEDVPPTGYVGFLLYLGMSVNVLVASDQPLPPGSDRKAIRPIVTREVRTWTRLGFDAQIARLLSGWIECDLWLEGREREEIEIWGADWQGMRRRLVDAIDGLDGENWYEVGALSHRLAEQHPDMLGGTFTAASARAIPAGTDERTASIAQVLAIEIETAFTWFGKVQTGRTRPAGMAVRRVTPPPARPRGIANMPVLAIVDDGAITLHAPAPIHIWSLTAFGDAEDLRPVATYRLRQASVGRALGQGFDLAQITAYLEQQSGEPLPDTITSRLRAWTVGYRRVRLQRAVTVRSDASDQLPELREALKAAGVTIAGDLPDGQLVVLVPDGPDGTPHEEGLLAILRANGFAGQWSAPRPPESGSRS